MGCQSLSLVNFSHDLLQHHSTQAGAFPNLQARRLRSQVDGRPLACRCRSNLSVTTQDFTQPKDIRLRLLFTACPCHIHTLKTQTALNWILTIRIVQDLHNFALQPIHHSCALGKNFILTFSTNCLGGPTFAVSVWNQTSHVFKSSSQVFG